MSILTNNLHPDELFRYMHVRGPQKQDDKVGALFFEPLFYDRLSPSELEDIEENIETLYPKLVPFIGLPGALEDQSAQVAIYKATGEYIPTPGDYEKRYPEFTKFLSWLDANASATTFSDIKDKFSEIFDTNPETYMSGDPAKELRCILWDNLLASLYSADDPFMVTLACKYLAGMHLVEVLANYDLVDLEPYANNIPKVYHAKTLVPRWLFEEFAKIDLDPDEGVGDQEPDNDTEDVKGRATKLINAVKEIRAYISERQNNQTKVTDEFRKETAIELFNLNFDDLETFSDELKEIMESVWELKNPLKLLKGEEVVFSTETKAILQEFFGLPNLIQLDEAVPVILESLNGVLQKSATQNRGYSVRVGDAIVSSENFCLDDKVNDPCAINPRKQFESRGSFINSVLVGDLLVTKQQLIKYDAGEVAHVEAMMQGLEKERVHRRLNRTETVTSFTQESVNESERETQTTERFSMEKETSNTIQQNFQISAGVNTSGQYGLTNVSTSLDASYGTSSQQSNATATSYSRNITDRALSRVKELVRESQTITVINEVEETSSHSIKNETDDNFNGVYRWLDKFYLNKIMNYGRRLMFEFTVPEPANFYIYQKVKHAAINGMMEEPVHPALVIDILGGSLTDPSVLNDTNYAFWAARYAVDVTAPPAEWINVTKSFKDSHSSVQPMVFSSEITIDPNYMAFNADIQAFGHLTSLQGFVGSIGTHNFFYGSSNGFTLSNARNSVSIGWMCYGYDMVVDVFIRTTRTPEFYNQWKLETFNKIMAAYKAQQQAYDEWLNEQYTNNALNFISDSDNPGINREIEHLELKKRCIELFTAQRFESFDAATNGIQNLSNYPEILFKEAITEGNLVKFFEQAFEWENMTYIFYPYFWGRKSNWLALTNAEDKADPLFTKFLRAGYARITVPARPGFENYLLMFNMLSNAVSSLGCAWNFSPSLFGSLGISNEFSPGVNDPVYMSVTQELIAADGWSIENPNPNPVGHYVHKVPTNLVYVIPNSLTPTDPLPGLPDNSADPEIAPYI